MIFLRVTFRLFYFKVPKRIDLLTRHPFAVSGFLYESITED